MEDGPARRTDPDLEDVGPSSDGSEVDPSLRAEQIPRGRGGCLRGEAEAVERARAEEAEAVERESRRKRRREHEVAEERAQTLANRRHLEMLEERLRGELRAEIAQEFETRVNQEVRSQILTQMAEGQFEGNQFPMLMQILLSMRDIASSMQARQDRLEQQVAEQSGVWSRAMERHQARHNEMMEHILTLVAEGIMRGGPGPGTVTPAAAGAAPATPAPRRPRCGTCEACVFVASNPRSRRFCLQWTSAPPKVADAREEEKRHKKPKKDKKEKETKEPPVDHKPLGDRGPDGSPPGGGQVHDPFFGMGY